MSKAKHTPGPWELIKYAYQNHWSVQAPYPPAKLLPRATGHVCVASPGPHDNAAEQEANARLIAAAPDLLEALSELMADIVELASEYQICHEIMHSSYGKAAYTAIEKARTA